jgi:hypothetical protein
MTMTMAGPPPPRPASARDDADERAELDACLARLGIAERGAVTAVVPLHQRSWCYRVELRDADAVFVKRARPSATGEWSADVTAEAIRLQYLSTHLPGRAGFPEVLAHDAEQRTLVTTCFSGHEHLDQARVSAGAGPELAHVLGTELAALHSLTRATVDNSRVPEADCVESVLTTLLRPTPTVISSFPAGYVEVLLAIRTKGLAPVLTGLGAQARTITFIHGDLKSDNLLCHGSAVRLIDWETAGWGDPRWDLGAVIGDHVFGWLSGLPFTTPGGLSAWLAQAARPLSEVRADLSAFADGYRRAGGADYLVEAADLAVCLGFAAAFLLQRATAAALSAPVLPPLALAALHLARQLLTRPAELSGVLL